MGLQIIQGRDALLPGVFLLLSLAGVVNAFGSQATALTPWAIGVGMAATLGSRLLPQTDFVVVSSVAYGLFSGLFAARGRQLCQMRRAASA